METIDWASDEAKERMRIQSLHNLTGLKARIAIALDSVKTWLVLLTLGAWI
jgi:hypothetical protein